MYPVRMTVLPHFRGIVSVRRCTVTPTMEIPAQCMPYVRKFFNSPHHVILIFFGVFQTSTPLSTYFVKTESTCGDVRPDICENGFISTVKDCLQFAVFGKRNHFCWNEQTCLGAQWNTGNKFIHNRRGSDSCSSRFYDSYELPWG